MSKHTPGPWKFDREHWGILAPWTSTFQPTQSQLMGDYRGAFIADLAESHGSGRAGSRDFAKPEAEANARLIAAAPELLALVKDYQQLYETYAMQDMEPEQLQGELQPDVFKQVIEKRNKIQEIIAKAEGGAK